MRGLVVFAFLVGQATTGGAAEPPAGVVYLTQSRDWTALKTGWGDGCPLARELVRQAFLIAARDELGLVTRDGWLGSEMPSEGENAPWEFRTEPDKPVRLLHGLASQRAEVEQDLKPCPRDGIRVDYRLWTEIQERASRAEYVEALKKGGYTGQRHAQVPDLAVPAATERLLGQMNFLAQFRALRALHEQTRGQGESPALLGALVRGYANLGVLTEYYWHPAHKVFKARALLYSQRMLAQAPASPLAQWHRAYAVAMTSDDRWTEQELEEAEGSWLALAEKERPARPAWLPLITAMCRYQVETFDQPLGDPRLLELASLLRYVTVERAGGQTWAVKTAVDVLPLIPDCYRVHDGLCQFGGVALLHSATLAPIARTGQTLYTTVRALPGLPDAVLRTLPKTAVLEGLWRGLRPEVELEGLEQEFGGRRQLTEALLHCGAVASAAEPGEPAWETLGLLLRELSFMQAYRRAQFEGDYLGLPADEWLNRATPLVEGHPAQAIVETYRGDAEPRQQAIARLRQIDTGGLDLTAFALHERVRQDPKANAEPLFRALWRNFDLVTRDLVVAVRIFANWPTVKDRRWLGRNLQWRSTWSPMACRMLLETDEPKVEEKLPEWKKSALHYPGLATAVAEHYLQRDQPDEAEPLLVAALKLVPFDLAIRRQLARVYEQRGEHERWRTTLLEQLEQPDYYLDHASVQSDVAYDYMSRKQWEEALPYAEGAAQSGSAWGMQCAAECCEALQHFEEAEMLLHDCADRYEGPMPWYFFCRRTGHGDLVAARQAVEVLELRHAQAGDLGSYDFAAYYLLEGKPELALRELEQALLHYGQPNDAVWLALIADQAGDAPKRDLAWDRAKELAATGSGRLSSTGDSIFSLALLIQKDLAAGGHGKVDLELAQQCLEPLEEGDRFRFRYALAHYLNHHGQRETALGYWRQCMSCTGIAARYRTLAGAALLEHGITPADYQDLLRPDPNAEAAAQPASEPRQ